MAKTRIVCVRVCVCVCVGSRALWGPADLNVLARVRLGPCSPGDVLGAELQGRSARKAAEVALDTIVTDEVEEVRSWWRADAQLLTPTIKAT